MLLFNRLFIVSVLTAFLGLGLLFLPSPTHFSHSSHNGRTSAEGKPQQVPLQSASPFPSWNRALHASQSAQEGATWSSRLLSLPASLSLAVKYSSLEAALLARQSGLEKCPGFGSNCQVDALQCLAYATDFAQLRLEAVGQYQLQGGGGKAGVGGVEVGESGTMLHWVAPTLVTPLPIITRPEKKFTKQFVPKNKLCSTDGDN